MIYSAKISATPPSVPVPPSAPLQVAIVSKKYRRDACSQMAVMNAVKEFITNY